MELHFALQKLNSIEVEELELQNKRIALKQELLILEKIFETDGKNVLEIIETFRNELPLMQKEIKDERDKMLEITKNEYDEMIRTTHESIDAQKVETKKFIEFWEQQQIIIRNTHSFEHFVKINIGGSKFTTTNETLARFPDTTLGAIFSGNFKINTDDDGYVFIDRDGAHFRHILN